MSKFHFVPIPSMPHLKIGARVVDGQMDVRVFDAGSESVFDADPICSFEVKAADAVREAIRVALESS